MNLELIICLAVGDAINPFTYGSSKRYLHIVHKSCVCISLVTIVTICLGLDNGSAGIVVDLFLVELLALCLPLHMLMTSEPNANRARSKSSKLQIDMADIILVNIG